MQQNQTQINHWMVKTPTLHIIALVCRSAGSRSHENRDQMQYTWRNNRSEILQNLIWEEARSFAYMRTVMIQSAHQLIVALEMKKSKLSTSLSNRYYLSTSPSFSPILYLPLLQSRPINFPQPLHPPLYPPQSPRAASSAFLLDRTVTLPTAQLADPTMLNS